MTIVIKGTMLDGVTVKTEKVQDVDNQMLITYKRDGAYMREFSVRLYHANGKALISVLSTEAYWFPNDEDYDIPLRLDTETFDYPVPIELVMVGGAADPIKEKCEDIVRKDHMYMDIVSYIAEKYGLSYEYAEQLLDDLL